MMSDNYYKSHALTPEHFERINRRGMLAQGIDNAKTYFEKLQAIREYYKASEEDIKASFQRSPAAWASSYPYDWSRIFTHIEYLAWVSIRAKGRIVLYPQYPVLNYVIDFAHPCLKIGLELDGERWHDKEKDAARDEKLRAHGWTIYRIPGKEMYRTDFKEIYELYDDYDAHEDEGRVISDLKYWLMETGDGVIEAIKQIHFDKKERKIINDEITGWYLNYLHATLQKHQSEIL